MSGAVGLVIAFPLVYSVYLGVAESVRDIAIALTRQRQPGRHAVELAVEWKQISRPPVTP